MALVTFGVRGRSILDIKALAQVVKIDGGLRQDRFGHLFSSANRHNSRRLEAHR